MIFDLHNDLPTSNLSPDAQRIESLSVADTVIYAFWTTELKKPLQFIKQSLTNYTTKNRLFGVEDLGFADAHDLDELMLLQPVYCGLTHNYANRYAGGALQDRKLTKSGKEAIRKLNRAAVVLDLAHLSHRSFAEAADTALHIINSHTGLDSYFQHPRNLTDAEVHTVLEHNGIIGLTAVADFIGSTDYKAYVRLIDTFVQKFGIDGACIGTDFHGTKPLEGLSNYEDFERIKYTLENYGYTFREIRKIFYDNANNYFKYRRT